MSAEASSSTSNGNGAGAGDTLTPQYTREQILAFNKELESKTPQEILVWAIDNLDGLYQTTAFGLYVYQAHAVRARDWLISLGPARRRWT